MKELYAYRQRMLTNWQEIVPALEREVTSIPAERWHAIPPHGGWTCHQVLAHLRDIESLVIAPSIRSLLAGRDGALPPCPEDSAWLQGYRADEAPEEIFRSYVAIRSEETGLLMQLDAPPWNASARHPQFGVRTLQWWVEASLQHARRHLSLLQRQAR